MTAHSLCGSSSLKKRSKCSASCFEESRITEDHSTEQSDRGTRLHTIMEHLAFSKINLNRLPDDEAMPCAEAWDMVQESLGDEILPDGKTANGGVWFTEMRLECRSTAADGRSDWGTVDLIVLYPREKRAFIADYKFGGALIDHPLWNLQLQDYACNLWDASELGVDHDWCVEVTYIQPSARGAYNAQPHHFSPEDLGAIASRLRAIRNRAYSELDEYRVGQACQFCRAKKSCWARSAFLSQFVATDPLLVLDGKTPMELGEILSVVKVAEAEAKRIYGMVKEVMKGGTEIPGYSYNAEVNRISGSPNLRGLKPPEIHIKRTCANE